MTEHHPSCCPKPCICDVPAPERLEAYRLLVQGGCHALDTYARHEHEEESGLSLNVAHEATRQWIHLGNLTEDRALWPTETDVDEAIDMWLAYTGLLQDHLAGMLLLGTYGNLCETVTRTLREVAR